MGDQILSKGLKFASLRRPVWVGAVMGTLFAVGLIIGRSTAPHEELSFRPLPHVAVTTAADMGVPSLAAPMAVTPLRSAPTTSQTPGAVTPAPRAYATSSVPTSVAKEGATSQSRTKSIGKSGGSSGEVVSSGSGG